MSVSARRSGRHRSSRAVVLAFVVVLLGLLAGPAGAAGGSLAAYLEQVPPGDLIPGAERFGEVQDDPPAAPIYRGGERVGHALLNTDYSRAIGYSSKPISILIGIDTQGVIRGTRLVEHHEPIVLIGIPEGKIRRFLDHFLGFDATQERDAKAAVDIVSGATVTVLVMEDSVLWAAQQAARRLGLGAVAPATAETHAATRAVDRDRPAEVKDWASLLEEGAIAPMRLSVADVNEAFAAMDEPEAARRPEEGAPDDTFIELYTGLLTIPTVGRSLLGERRWENLRERLEPGEEAIFVAGRGRYSFKGSGYVRGGIFDRIELSHAGGTTRFHDYEHTRLGQLAAAGAPALDEVSLFTVPAAAGFDPARPWQLRLLVQRETGPLSKVFTRFTTEYRPPAQYLTAPPAAAGSGEAGAAAGEQARRRRQVGGPPPDRADALWRGVWERKRAPITGLAVLLAVVTVIFFFQNWLTRRPAVLKWTRFTVLAVVLVWLGWWSNAQLSVVNIFTLTNSVLSGFSWSYFLMDPLVFILWSATAAGMIFWARGAFCGWLCPFGALQELTNRAGQRLGIRQISVPFAVHERLWPIKYILFLLLFGLALYDLALAERFAEVEPFKTAIILNFVRDWPYVVYAIALLVIGLFIERFFCRYLCPLGAALAIPARLRTFEWLKRWPECGTQCHRCARECPVQSIHPEGHINVNECIYCLHCQELYFDEHRCPHNVTRRLKRERRMALGRRGQQDYTAADAGAHEPPGEPAVHAVSWAPPRSSKRDDPTQEGGQ